MATTEIDLFINQGQSFQNIIDSLINFIKSYMTSINLDIDPNINHGNFDRNDPFILLLFSIIKPVSHSVEHPLEYLESNDETGPNNKVASSQPIKTGEFGSHAVEHPLEYLEPNDETGPNNKVASSQPIKTGEFGSHAVEHPLEYLEPNDEIGPNNKVASSQPTKTGEFGSHAVNINNNSQTGGDDNNTYDIRKNLNNVLVMLNYIKIMIQNFNYIMIKIDEEIKEKLTEEQLSIYKSLVLGYVYYLQHSIETILFGTPYETKDYNVAIMFYKTIFDYRRHVIETIRQGNAGIVKQEMSSSLRDFLPLLLKFLGTIQNIVGEKNYSQILLVKDNPDELIVKLAEKFAQLSDIANETESQAYVQFFEKLQNLKAVCENILNKKDKIIEKHSVYIPQTSKLYCNTSDIKFCLKDLGLDIITNITPSTPLPEISIKDNTLRNILAYSTFVSQYMKAPAVKPSKKDITEITSKKIKELYTNDSIYYQLVDFYETISGSVRVYLRTKDYISGIGAIKNFSNVNQIDYDIDNGIKKNYYKNTISFDKSDILVNDLEYGPFYKVIDTGTSNEDIINKQMIDMDNIINMFNMMDSATDGSKRNIIFFTYGLSGAGKTYTLFGNKGAKDGIWFYMNKKLGEAGLTSKYLGCKKVYGLFTNKNFKKDIIKTNDTVFDKFLENQIFIEGNVTNTDAFIKSTPNNKASSRGFLIVSFEILKGNKSLGKFGMVDMAGNEDPYDLMVKLLPTLKWPQITISKDKNFITEESSLVDIDFTYEALFNSYMNTYTSILNIIYGICGFINSFSTIGDPVKDKIETGVKDRLLKDLEDIGNKYILNDNPKTFTDLMNKQIYLFIKADAFTWMMELINQLKQIPIFNGYFVGLKEELTNKFKQLTDKHDIFYYKLLQTNFNFKVSEIDSKNRNKIAKAVSLDINIKLMKYDETITALQMVYYTIENEINNTINKLKIENPELMDTLLKDVNELISLYDPIDFISYKNNNPKPDESIDFEDCKIDFRTMKLSWRTFNKPADFSKNCFKDRLSQLDGKKAYCNKDKFSINFDGKKEYKDYTECLIDKIDTVIYKCMKIDDKNKILPVLKLVSLIKHKYNILIPQIVSCPLEYKNISDIIDVFKYTLDIKNIKSTAGITTGSIAPENTINAFKALFKDHVNKYFKTLKRKILIDGTEIDFSTDYLLRIIQEGFYINQANKELVTYLQNKQSTDALVNKTNCPLVIENLYFEKYNKFNSLYEDGCKITGLTEELDSQFKSNEKEQTKYIMICNLRREKDIKVRLGTIDTLKLVEQLKST
jgi:hypothetical protein